jgi:hypothetical protein
MINSIMKNKFLYLFITPMLILILTTLVILLARGYTIDFTNKRLESTGILALNSLPDGALVYINEISKDVTNTSITDLKPGNYKIKLEKDGFRTWEKEVLIQKELVTEIEALLVPIYPSFKPLTYTGVNRPSISPDGQKIIYFVYNQGSSSGLWLVDLEERPFNLSQKPELLLAASENNPFVNIKSLEWSPDSSEVLITTDTGSQLLNLKTNVSQSQSNEQTASIRTDWTSQDKLITTNRLKTISEKDQQFLKEIDKPMWSPDSDKILYSINENNETHYYVYNLESVSKINNLTPSSNPIKIMSISSTEKQSIQWFPNSTHLLLVHGGEEESRVEVIESDGGNPSQIFAGKIKDLQVYPNPNGNKVIVLTNFGEDNSDFNLYSLNLR